MKIPVTLATRALKAAKVPYSEHLYTYEEKGGTATSARAFNVPESQVVKTLVFKDERNRPLVVLMTGDKEVSTKMMARLLGTKSIKSCTPQEALKHSGYQVGGTSPFGLKTAMPIYLEKCILGHDLIFINGGKRGFLVCLNPEDLRNMLQPECVEVGIS